MSPSSKFFIFLLRISMGAFMFYAGITKILNPAWTSAGYLKAAITFPEIYAWLLMPSNIIWVDLINKWGLTLLGISLILGVGVRLSAPLGALLMLLYYFPILNFPLVGERSYIVDDHIIYAAVLLLLASAHAGRIWGLERWFVNFPVIGRFT